MITGIKFRKRADDCLREANSVADPERRLAHLDLAERWLRLATQIDKIKAPARCDAPLEHDPEKWIRFSEKIMLHQKVRAG
jgi:hypothetical protein